MILKPLSHPVKKEKRSKERTYTNEMKEDKMCFWFENGSQKWKKKNSKWDRHIGTKWCTSPIIVLLSFCSIHVDELGKEKW